VKSKRHKSYSAHEAAAAFGGGEYAKMYCDGQFAVLPTAVLGFIMIGADKDESHVPTPSQVVWRPARLDYEPSDSFPWLPKDVREVWDRSQKEVRKLRDHHLFLRLPAEERFFYAGEAHLGSYGGAPDSTGRGVVAHFWLKEKLPRGTWLKFGGFPGWLVEVNHHSHSVAADDSATFEGLVAELPSQEFSHLCMTRYEEDSLTVYTNALRGWLMYLREPEDSGMYTRDPGYRGSPKSEEVFRCVCGISLEFSTAQTLPRELAIQAAVEFFQTGRIPESFPWESA
jgi:hypothetical protein